MPFGQDTDGNRWTITVAGEIETTTVERGPRSVNRPALGEPYEPVDGRRDLPAKEGVCSGDPAKAVLVPLRLADLVGGRCSPRHAFPSSSQPSSLEVLQT